MEKILSIMMPHFSLNFDKTKQIRKLFSQFFNQQKFVKISVFCENHLISLDQPEWLKSVHLSNGVLSTESYHPFFDFTITTEEKLHSTMQVYINKIKITNHKKVDRDIKIVFSQYTSDTNTLDLETAFYAPYEKVLIHYRSNNEKYWLVNGCFDTKGISQYAVCKKDEEESIMTPKGTFIHYSPFAHGNVCSVFTLEDTVGSQEEKTAYYWLAANESKQEVLRVNNQMIALAENEFKYESALNNVVKFNPPTTLSWNLK